MRGASERRRLRHEFVKYVPDVLEPGVLYVTVEYATAVHLCCCGCNNEVVTPFGPTDWRLVFDGETVSLQPSIGNWSFPCRSHYWIRKNEVRWAGDCSDERVAAGRHRDRVAKVRHFDLPAEPPAPEDDLGVVAPTATEGMWARAKRWFRKLWR